MVRFLFLLVNLFLIFNYVSQKLAIIAILSVLATAFAQRPGYIRSGPVGYPDLAPRFQNKNDDSTPSLSDSNLSQKGFPLGQGNEVFIGKISKIGSTNFVSY